MTANRPPWCPYFTGNKYHLGGRWSRHVCDDKAVVLEDFDCAILAEGNGVFPPCNVFVEVFMSRLETVFWSWKWGRLESDVFMGRLDSKIETLQY